MLTVVLLSLVMSLIIGGCASQPARFYLLSALPYTEAAPMGVSGVQGPTIGAGPVTLPSYADRPQIATQTGPYELQLAEFDRWAEALDANFARVLADNLALRIPASRVVVSPWPRAKTIDYQVMIDVTHFPSHIGGESLLIADWILLKGEGPHVLTSEQSRFSVPTTG
jgi:uncharacterized lipoprotein YmbA